MPQKNLNQKIQAQEIEAWLANPITERVADAIKYMMEELTDHRANGALYDPENPTKTMRLNAEVSAQLNILTLLHYSVTDQEQAELLINKPEEEEIEQH